MLDHNIRSDIIESIYYFKLFFTNQLLDKIKKKLHKTRFRLKQISYNFW